MVQNIKFWWTLYSECPTNETIPNWWNSIKDNKNEFPWATTPYSESTHKHFTQYLTVKRRILEPVEGD